MTERKKHLREQMVAYFRNVAAEENKKNSMSIMTLEDLLDKTGRKRFLIVCKESIGDLLNVTALLKSFKDQYSDWDLYLACDPQYFEIFEGNPYLHKVLPYQPMMESEPGMTGMGKHKGFFDGYCFVPVLAQRFLSYLTNNKIALSLT